ncbi:MAG: prepilin-type N-terminal cleavage/methylation domain-containing protein [bacterium]|nr:prepilin-type N-terminal cleavage/methylation domain-containing protein [bacterium]
MKRGFTFLEILIVLGVLAILATIVTTAISNFRRHALLAEVKNRALSELNLAKSQTLGSEGNAQYGVHFETGKIVRFKGAAYSASDPANQVYELPAGVRISSIALGGPAEVVFERLTGRASASGIVTILLSSDADSFTTITINSSGIAE